MNQLFQGKNYQLMIVKSVGSEDKTENSPLKFYNVQPVNNQSHDPRWKKAFHEFLYKHYLCSLSFSLGRRSDKVNFMSTPRVKVFFVSPHRRNCPHITAICDKSGTTQCHKALHYPEYHPSTALTAKRRENFDSMLSSGPTKGSSCARWTQGYSCHSAW